MDFNKVILMGRLTRDVELRYLSSGMAVADLGVAANHKYRRGDGEMVEETCFVDVTVWGKSAENSNQYLSKGRGVLIEGRLKYESWESDGQKRNKLKVIADRIQFLPGGRGEGGGGGGQQQQQQGVSDYGRDHSSSPPPTNPAPPAQQGDYGGGAYHDDNVPF